MQNSAGSGCGDGLQNDLDRIDKVVEKKLKKNKKKKRKRKEKKFIA